MRCVHGAMFVEGEACEMCVHVVMFVEGKACEMCVHVVMFVEGKACEMCTWCNVRGQRGTACDTWTSYSVQTTTGHTTLVTEFVAPRSCHNVIFSSQPWPLKGKEHKVQETPPPPPPPPPPPSLLLFCVARMVIVSCPQRRRHRKSSYRCRHLGQRRPTHRDADGMTYCRHSRLENRQTPALAWTPTATGHLPPLAPGHLPPLGMGHLRGAEFWSLLGLRGAELCSLVGLRGAELCSLVGLRGAELLFTGRTERC